MRKMCAVARRQPIIIPDCILRRPSEVKRRSFRRLPSRDASRFERV
jgi:hypothetical protein